VNLKKNLESVKKNITNQTLIIATKYVDSAEIYELYQLGIRDFGENRVADMLRKKIALNELPIRWHFIGHLQSNKVRQVINHIDVLHSLDSLKLAEQIQKERHGLIECFIEIKLTDEPNKTGILPSELHAFVQSIGKYDIIKIVGLMGMAEANGEASKIRQSFEFLRSLRDEIRDSHIPYAPCEFLSMGMSDDYLIAIKCGTTHLRLGSIIFRSEE